MLRRGFLETAAPPNCGIPARTGYSRWTASRSYTISRSLDQLLYGPAPTRLGSDRPGSGSIRSPQPLYTGCPGTIYTANRQIVQARTLECRISRSTTYSLRRDPDKHFSRASTSPTTPGHRQALRPRGASTSASPTLPRHVR